MTTGFVRSLGAARWLAKLHEPSTTLKNSSVFQIAALPRAM